VAFAGEAMALRRANRSRRSTRSWRRAADHSGAGFRGSQIYACINMRFPVHCATLENIRHDHKRQTQFVTKASADAAPGLWPNGLQSRALKQVFAGRFFSLQRNRLTHKD